VFNAKINSSKVIWKKEEEGESGRQRGGRSG
jgi:hypothetical protein